MNEEMELRIKALELENKKLKLASQQWGQLQKIYQESNEKLKQLEQELAVENMRIGKALQGGEVIWWDFDCSSGNLVFSDRISDLLGVGPSGLPSTFKEYSRLIHPEDYQQTLLVRDNLLNGKVQSYESEYRLTAQDGTWRWYLDKGSIVEADILGSPKRLSGVLIDINERKKKEIQLFEAREKAEDDSRTKSRFLANMSHEIYTPMAGVIGMAEILKQSKLTREQEEYLGVLVKSATNLMSILNDIIEYSKIDAGHFDFHEKPFNIHQVVEELTCSMLSQAEEKGIEILSFQDPNIPAELIGDPVRLRQVLKIFADNAIKFTEKGEVHIEAEFVEWDEENVTVRFNISDTGIGISEEGQKKLFTSFAKLNPDETQKYGGGGLGLAIARRIISRMDGQIHVESKAGEGTTFSFTVVFERYRDAESADPMKDLLRGVKILLVDPSQARRRIFEAYFERWEAETKWCSTAAEALKMITGQARLSRPFELVMLDYEIPDLNGLQFAASVKRDPLVQKSRMILVTPASVKLSKTELISGGIQAGLSRPVILSRLKSKLREVLINTRRADDTGADDDIHHVDDARRVLNILLAEDNLINQKVALVTLQKMGHQTDLAENGKIAVEKATSQSYDLILMDIHMPEMDGLEATRQIRQYESQHTGSVPVHICAITANTSQEDEDLCYKAGMNSYISKPFRLAELMKVLSHI